MSYIHRNFLQHIIGPVRTIVEAGARYGHESITLRRVFPHAQIFSFEPNPVTVGTCEKNLRDMDRIEFFQKALGSKNEKLPFYSYMKDNDGASSFLKRLDFDITQEQTGVVDVIRLEDFVTEHEIESIDLLCMDVQGFELNILKGAGDFINNVKHVIMEEPNPIIDDRFLPSGTYSFYLDAPSPSEISKFMISNGFEEVSRMVENDIEHNVMYRRKQ